WRNSCTSSIPAGSRASSHQGRSRVKPSSSVMLPTPRHRQQCEAQTQQQSGTQRPMVQGGGLAVRQPGAQGRLQLIQPLVDVLHIAGVAGTEVLATGQLGYFAQAGLIQFDRGVGLQAEEAEGAFLGQGVSANAYGEDADLMLGGQPCGTQGA